MDLLDIVIAKQLSGGGGGSGTDNYNDLSNLPKINDTTLSGNKSSSALGLQSEINSDSKLASDLVDDTNQDNKFVTSTEKNTWNAKQNAIDADHKLSSSLVSFSTAEAAALASGIDSTKVGQISTNQTNILYGIKTGVKNIIVLPDGVYQPSSKTTFTVVDGAVTCETTASYTDAIYISAFVIPAGTYSLTGIENNTGFQVRLYNNGTRIEGNPITLDVDTTVSVALYSLGSNSSGTLTPMICLKSIYDQDSSYAKPALPNYDLTRLEAEDRAGLVDVVDSGAKNLAEIPTTQTIGSTTFTKDSNEWITSSSSTPDGRQWSDANKNVSYSVKAGSYIIYGETPNTNTGAVDAYVIVNGSLNKPLILTANSNGTVEVNLTSAGTIGLMYKPYSTNKVRYMLCTKAAFGVSPKFVPYKPDWDLVGGLATALTSTEFNTATGVSNYVTNIDGGFIRIGNLVVVNIRCTVANNIPMDTAFINGIPKSLLNYNLGLVGVAITNNQNIAMYVDGYGNIKNGSDSAIAANTSLVISCTYFTK